jgi:hypothetical protein
VHVARDEGIDQGINMDPPADGAEPPPPGDEEPPLPPREAPPDNEPAPDTD